MARQSPYEIELSTEARKTLEACRDSRNGPGTGGPRSFPPGGVVEIKALACERPFALGLPLSRLHVPDIRIK